MCNLYEIPQSKADIAAHFDVLDSPTFDIPRETKRANEASSFVAQKASA